MRHILKFRPRQGRPPPARTGAVSSSAPAYATATVEPSIVTSFVVDNELIVIPRWYVKKGGPLCNKTVSEVMVDYGFGVPERRAVGVKPKLFPPPDTRLLEGDGVLVQGPLQELQSLKRRALSVASVSRSTSSDQARKARTRSGEAGVRAASNLRLGSES